MHSTGIKVEPHTASHLAPCYQKHKPSVVSHCIAKESCDAASKQACCHSKHHNSMLARYNLASTSHIMLLARCSYMVIHGLRTSSLIQRPRQCTMQCSLQIPRCMCLGTALHADLPSRSKQPYNNHGPALKYWLAFCLSMHCKHTFGRSLHHKPQTAKNWCDEACKPRGKLA